MPTMHSCSTLCRPHASSKCSSGLPQKPRVDTFFKKEVKQSHLITTARGAAARCNVCKGYTNRQFICLRDSVHTSLREQIDTDSTIIPEHLRWPAITAETLMELYDGRYLDIVLYDCPMKPTEVNKFSDFFAVASDILRQPKNCIVDNPHLSDPVIWEDLFHDEIQYV
ncbi:hypothetical protein EDC04DRAFT_2601248 [Pisolithus marmoratus]|nr:hypothetical protein EDC04DRAFT_2601248 [Pisolithus marmoratus]